MAFKIENLIFCYTQHIQIQWRCCTKLDFDYRSLLFEYRYNKLGDETDDGVAYPSLSVINAGVKVKPGKAWQIAFGCNDIFNRASKQKGWVCLGTNSYGYLNVEYPIQGRTWYGTVRYEF